MPTPLTWDSPAGLTYDMPGLTWDMQVPDPPPPPPKRRPFHRSPNTNSTPTPAPTHMSTFTYHPAPKSTGGFTTRAVLGDQIVEADFNAMIAAAAGV